MSGTPTDPGSTADRDPLADLANRPARSELAFNLNLLAGVIAVAAIITGIVLMNHTAPSCTVNPYDSSVLDCSGKRHDRIGYGAAVLAGGVLQAMMFAALAAIVARLDKLAESRRAAGSGATTDSYGDG